MTDILGLYENIDKKKIDLCINDSEKFDYVSKTSIHSEVTDWAYGLPLKMSCVNIRDSRCLSGEVYITDLNRRFFLKVIACMPNWTKYVNSFTVIVNGSTAYDNKETFFEQVNLGWPALYIEIDKNTLIKGKNVFSISTTNASGGGLYVSELLLVSYPIAENLSQVSIRNFSKVGDIFGVAVKDVERKFKRVINTVNCSFIKQYYYNDLCVFTFIGNKAGKAYADAVFGDKTVKLILPEIVENSDNFLLGTDSDDHRHDESDETAFVVETAVFSGMGNFIQFRPQYGRNYYKLMPKKGFEEIIGLISAFGMKYGLCDCDGVMDYLPDIKPENFFGYHIHEPYLFFNPALLNNPFEKEKFLCEPKKIRASSSFGESKKLYMSVLRRSKERFSKGKGLTSFGSPSLLCVYEGDSGANRITIEPVSNINLLTGAVRASSVQLWGAHIPTDWYFGVPVDTVKANKYRLAMQYLYLNGASYIYAENSLFKTNAFERCDWESEFCTINRKYLREFYDYVLTHPRKGKLIVNKAIVYGRNEFIMWKINDRMAELKEKDWDSNVWGKWDNAYHVVWNASEAWLPSSDKQNEIESPLNKKLFSGTPYGNVDIVSAEKDFSAYSQIVFLGWNTMDDDLLERLKEYVKNGGTLAVSYCHFNYTDRNDKDMNFPCAEKLKDFLGVEIAGETAVEGTIRFSDEAVDISAVKAVKCNPITAAVIADDKNGLGVVYKNGYGKGVVYFTAIKEYVTEEKDVELYKKVMRIVGETGYEHCDNVNVSYTVRETENSYNISVLNMNCIEGSDEKFTIEYKGQKIFGEIKVGEIFEYCLNKNKKERLQ